MCVSATATPSAASDGVGARVSLRSRATTAPTCALGAPPAPATVFFTVAGGYSAISRPACSAASSTRSEEHTSELQSLAYLVCRLLLEKKKILHHPSCKHADTTSLMLP